MDRPSAFARRQEGERRGYDAAEEGVSPALRRLAEIEAPGDRAAFLRGMFAQFIENGSLDAVQAIKQLPNEAERGLALRALVESRQSAESVSDHRDFGKPDGDQRQDQLTAEVLEASKDALAFGAGLGERAALIYQLADQPELAAGLARELLKGSERRSLLSEMAGREVLRDPARALSFGESLEGKERADFLAHVAWRWGAADSAAAWAWAGGQSDAVTREAMQEAVIRGLASSDPSAAAQHVAQLGKGEAGQRALDVVGQNWGATDTQAALAWANALPDAQERDSALAGIRKSAPVGIGAAVGTDAEGFPFIQEVLPGGPASENPQLVKGARIVSVRDATGATVELKGKNLEETIGLLRGTPGSAVTMEIIPPTGSPSDRQIVVLTRRQLTRRR